MSIKCINIINKIEELAPKRLAYEWDNVGLLIGDYNQNIKKVLISLDASQSVIKEAIEKNVDLIITHHPMIFKGIKQINTSSIVGEKVIKLIKNNISLYTAHTNLDAANSGVSDILAEKLKLHNSKILNITSKESLYNNKLDRVAEEIGIGRVGELEEEMTLGAFVQSVKEQLELDNVRVVGNLSEKIKKVAVSPGSSMGFVKDAIEAKADVYVTGDIKYHEAFDMLEAGMPLIDAGHFGTENILLPEIKEYLDKHFGKDIEVNLSQVNKDPFTII